MAVTWKKLAYEADIVTKALFDANTILAANTDDTPAAVTVIEQRLLGRITSGNITALTAAQVLTLLGFDSSVYLSPSINQDITDSASSTIRLDTETYDVQNEFDNTVISGTADATAANKLHDADGGFSSGDVGKIVWNTTDTNYTTVSGFVDSGELDLTDDIMASGEGYHLYFAKFTATATGKYLVIWEAAFEVDSTGARIVRIYKNGVSSIISMSFGGHSATLYGGAMVVVIMSLSANDYLQFRTKQTSGSTIYTKSGAAYTFLMIQKLS